VSGSPSYRFSIHPCYYAPVPPLHHTVTREKKHHFYDGVLSSVYNKKQRWYNISGIWYSSYARTTIENYTIPAITGVKENTPAKFFSLVLPIGSYCIRGTLSVTPVAPWKLDQFIIYCANNDNPKNVLAGVDYGKATYASLQNAPFTIFFVIDGIKPFELVFQGIGSQTFNILSAKDDLQLFKLP
jgi:hypothetical protein